MITHLLKLAFIKRYLLHQGSLELLVFCFVVICSLLSVLVSLLRTVLVQSF